MRRASGRFSEAICSIYTFLGYQLLHVGDPVRGWGKGKKGNVTNVIFSCAWRGRSGSSDNSPHNLRFSLAWALILTSTFLLFIQLLRSLINFHFANRFSFASKQFVLLEIWDLFCSIKKCHCWSEIEYWFEDWILIDFTLCFTLRSVERSPVSKHFPNFCFHVIRDSYLPLPTLTIFKFVFRVIERASEKENLYKLFPRLRHIDPFSTLSQIKFPFEGKR